MQNRIKAAPPPGLTRSKQRTGGGLPEQAAQLGKT